MHPRSRLLLLFIFISFFIRIQLNAQDYQFLESVLEEIEDENEDNSEWMEYLWELIQNPLDLNKATAKDLNRIPFLDSPTTKKIIAYRKRKHGFTDIQELTFVKGVSEELFEALRPLITVKEKSGQMSFANRIRLKYESPSRRGFLEKIYGNPVYLQNRFMFRLNEKVKGGFLLEKDAGEQRLTDYASFYFRYKNSSRGGSVLVGDYYTEIGEGLVMWSAYGMPVSPYFMSFYMNEEGSVLENRMSNEFNYLRGFSVQKRVGRNFSLNFFYSRRPLDASLGDDSSSVQSYSLSGLHRSENEKRKAGIWNTNLLGGVLSKTVGEANFQFSAIQTRQNFPYRSLKKDQIHLSFYYQVQFGEVHPTAELSLFQKKYPAIQQYIYISHKNTRYGMVMYYYHPRYFALFGRAFGSLSQVPQNKMGLAFIINHRFSGGRRLGGYAHFYREIRNSEALPFPRRDFMLELTQRLSGQQIKIQFKQKYRENNLTGSSEMNKRIQLLRLTHYFNSSRRLRFQNRLELHWAEPLKSVNRSYGLALYHQINFQVEKKWRIVTRWTSFDVPDYDLRMYEYEPDLPGTFRTVLLNNRGYKWIFLFRWLPTKNAQLDFKYQQRFYPDLDNVGSGLDEIHANRVHEFRMSLIFHY